MAKPMLCVEPVTNEILSLSNISVLQIFFEPLLPQSIAPSNAQDRLAEF
jgi:hypothetical protein